MSEQSQETREAGCTCGDAWPCPLHGGPPQRSISTQTKTPTMQIKETVKKSYLLINRQNAVELVEDLLTSTNDVVSLTFMERTWITGDGDEKFEVDITYRQELRK
jgi:hypothetical protein